MAISAGLYELRTMLQTAMAVDVAGASTTKGANVQLYSVNDTNAQKFRLIYRGNGWNLVNAASAMYVDVDNYGTTDGTNIKQWTNNNNRAQRWEVTDTGETVIIDGVECIIAAFGSYVTTAHNMMMDVRWALTTDKTNIQLYHSNGTDAQRFALYPTELLDKSLATPSILGWATSLYGDGQLQQFGQTKLYPTWKFPDAWAPGTAAFAYSYRSRSIGATVPGAWSAWTAWTSAPIVTRGTQAWLVGGLPAVVSEKALEYQFRLRSVSTNSDGEAIHSMPVTATLRAAYAPTISISSAEAGFDALGLVFSSDYTDGTNILYVDSIIKDGAEILARPVTISGLGASGTAPIEMSDLLAPLQSGDFIEVAYRVGTDQLSQVSSSTIASATVEWASGHSDAPEPTINEVDGRMLAVSYLGTDVEQVWTVTSSGMWPAYQTGTGWKAIYPFGEDFSIYAAGTDGSSWSSVLVEKSASDMPKGCHAWSWDGGYFLLDVVDGIMATNRKIDAQADVMSLNSRDWQTVTYSDTLEGSFDAEGVIDVPVTASVKAQLMALIKAHHVTYRAPLGEVCSVGIDSVKYESSKLRTDVTVSMTQESI